MSTRAEVLARVRTALGAQPDPVPAVRTAPQIGDKADGPRPGDLDLFVERVADYRAEVERCTPDRLTERVVAATAGQRVVVPPGLPFDVDGASVEDPGSPLSRRELDGFDTVVTRVRVAIAETGTFVLDHAADQGRRALTLLPDRHVCVIDVGQVVADVADALLLLDPRRPQTWVSGPSATSDIELTRVEGVHGPRRLHVILVG